MTAAAWAQDGLTTHIRFKPFERRFSQRFGQVTLDIDRIAEATGALRLFGYNRPNLFSFYDADHGDRSGAPLRAWAERMFASAGVRADGRIEITCFPRVSGFVFNPLSVFVAYGPDEAPRGFIYEVNNTFGETHSYVARADDGDMHEHGAAKRFHVSPFMDVSGRYRFRLQTPGERFRLVVENWIGEERVHLATLLSLRRPLSDAWLAGRFLRFPFMTAQVVIGIHVHALFIWLRGAQYRRKPAAPAAPATLVNSATSTR